MADVFPLLKPYEACTLVNPDSEGDPYFTLGLIDSKTGMGHYMTRRLIYNYMFRLDEEEAQFIRIQHEIGDFTLYGSNLSPIVEQLEEIKELTVFDPSSHQPVADPHAPIFTRMEFEEKQRHTPFRLLRDGFGATPVSQGKTSGDPS